MPELTVDKWFTWNYDLPYWTFALSNVQRFRIEMIAADTAEAFERDGTGDLYDTDIAAWVWTASMSDDDLRVRIRVSVPLRALSRWW